MSSPSPHYGELLREGYASLGGDSSPQLSKRIVPRFEFEARFRIELNRVGEPLLTEGWARDLSESGVGAFVAAPLLVGEMATLTIPLPTGEELVIPAKVRRNLGTQYGFEFTALSAEQRKQIADVLAASHALPLGRYHI